MQHFCVKRWYLCNIYIGTVFLQIYICKKTAFLHNNITITFICMTIIIYSIAKGTLKQEQQEKEIIIMILITDNQVTSFLDDRILSRKLFNNEI